MITCWAKSLGNCNKTISREHLISKGIFVDRNISVKGFSWCKDEFKSIGINALTRKCLCQRHNNLLSPVDNEGIKLFQSLDKIAEFTVSSNTSHEKSVNAVIDGFLLERWFLKTLINLSYKSEYLIGGFGKEKGIPHEYLVDIAYGKTRFTGHLGLYTIVYDGDRSKSYGRVGFTPLVNGKGFIGGGVFYFRGVDYFLSLVPAPPPRKLADIDISGFPEKILQSKLLYRCPEIIVSKNNKIHHTIRITY